MITAKPLPERIEDSAFLNNIPTEIDEAEAKKRFYHYVEEFGLMDEGTINAEWVAGLKIILGLQAYSRNISTNMVLLRAIDEVDRMCGYHSPELIISSLFQRRAEYQRTLAEAQK